MRSKGKQENSSFSRLQTRKAQSTFISPSPSVSQSSAALALQSLILFRGPPGVGKTTLSRLLRRKINKLAVIKFDAIRRIVSEDPRRLKKLSFIATQNLVHFFLKRGYSVLVDELFISNREIEPFFQIAQAWKIPFFLFDLIAPTKILKERVCAKKEEPLKGGAKRLVFLLSFFKREKIDKEKFLPIKISTAGKSPEETVDEIFLALQKGWKRIQRKNTQGGNFEF